VVLRVPSVSVSRDEPTSDTSWFRAPSRREHWIASGLFVGFGVFFVLLFFLQRGWWFSWVLLGLGMFSIVRGMWHTLEAVRMKG
jgi:hypothetical protein